MKKILLLSLVLILVFIAGCASPKNPEKIIKDEITISAGVNLVAGGYDPTAGYGVWAPDIFHSHLLQVKANNQLENDLATSYEVSPDGLIYTFKIRTDAKFADGHPLTSDDVVFTFTTAKSKASAADLTMLDSIEALDEHTVVFHLKYPWSTFVFHLSEVGIVPKHAYHSNYGDHPVGSGAWKVVEFAKEQQLILMPNEHYYGIKPKFKKVTILKLDEDAALAAAKSGQLDLVLIESEFAKTDVAGMKLYRMAAMDALTVNLPTIPEMTDAAGKKAGNTVTGDPAIRKALNIGIDRQTIIDNALSGFGQVAYGAAPALPWSNGDTFQDNRVEEAKKLLEAAGWKDADGDGVREKNGLRAEFVITGRSNDQARYNTVVALAEDAKKLGIKIIPKSAPWSECREARNIPTCWVFGQPNPIEFYRYYDSSQIGKAVIGNPASYANPEVDAVVKKALTAKNMEEANRYWQEGQTLAQRDVPYLWIARPDVTYLIREGLQLPSLKKLPTRGQGISIVENMNEWFWE
ncbi:ABC transporter substrate-binding protein [Acetonema longum]|uniref:Extracellular solute-binding protein family 5 n=1 Tax=Acetonema longum DSM 6540 TaxID=1009370 RepID=F7NFG8_9FIRM|nr:ABC transporter substrate-binding protein [Acetonema longum]EGO65223.1 extracellular solute-binding protein family 5 [Acetonema longum DSM 6540]